MTKNGKDIWFPAMKYGIGWGLPIAWQGWVVFLAYMVLMVSGSLFIRHSSVLIIPFIIYALLLTGIFVFICWKKGEKPELR